MNATLAQLTTMRDARTWLYREQLRKVEPMRDIVHRIRRHIEGIIAWAQTRQRNGFLEVLNALFHAVKWKTSGHGRITSVRTEILLLAGKPNFSKLNPLLLLNPFGTQQSTYFHWGRCLGDSLIVTNEPWLV